MGNQERKKERITENSIAQDFSPKVFGIGKADRSVPSMVDRRKKGYLQSFQPSSLPFFRAIVFEQRDRDFKVFSFPSFKVRSPVLEN